MQALELSKDCLCNDNELPVRVEAAIALQMLVTQHEKGQYIFIFFFVVVAIIHFKIKF